MINKEINAVCNPTKPPKADAKATKCLAILLAGGVINRKSLADWGFAANNDSVHSLISILRNERFIPIESSRQHDGTSNYFMLQSEIDRYNNPILRQHQRDEMKAIVEAKRQRRIAALLSKRKSGS
jgi:hypothetical protein